MFNCKVPTIPRRSGMNVLIILALQSAVGVTLPASSSTPGTRDAARSAENLPSTGPRTITNNSSPLLRSSTRRRLTNSASSEVSDSCTMHTYFSTISESMEEHAANQNLIANWRRVWESSGWKTRVINEDDAKSHPKYAKLREAFMALPTVLHKNSNRG